MEMKVIHGDCIEIVPTLGKFDLVFADPPFNIGQEYVGFDDKVNVGEYIAFTYGWIQACWNSLKPNGLMALHGPDHVAELYLDVAKALRMTRVDWVNWHYNFNQNTSIKKAKRFGCTRCHLLVFAKNPNSWTFNAEDVAVPSLRKSVYNDKRTDSEAKEFEGGGMKVPGSVWGIPSDGANWGRIQGNSKERRKGHPNQLPERYSERVIRAWSNRGDRVLDPFAGAGGTAVVCQALGRKCVTIDISKASVDSVTDRLKKGAVRV